MVKVKEYEMNGFDLKEITKERGRKSEGYINFAMKANGSWVRIPIVIAAGRNDGPIVMADACVHGDEYEGTEGLMKLYHSLDVEKMSGTFVGIPAVNFEAFNEMQRFNTCDFVPSDMNRIFPGSPEGYMTQSLTYHYYEKLIKQVDALITLHGGGNYLYLSPVTNFQDMGDEASKKSEEMAKAFGFNALWRDHACDGVGGMEDHYAYLAGVPTITPEIGGQSTRLHHREENIARISDGIENVLRYWNILEGEVKTFADQYYVNLEYIYSNHGGIHKPQKKENEVVKKGDVLSIITDVFGNEIERVLSPSDGVVIGFLVYSIVNPKSWTYLLGTNVKKEK